MLEAVAAVEAAVSSVLKTYKVTLGWLCRLRPEIERTAPHKLDRPSNRT